MNRAYLLASHICGQISEHGSLRCLDLSDNHLQSADVNLVLEHLRDKPLTKLDLSYNYLGRACTDYIMENLLNSTLF